MSVNNSTNSSQYTDLFEEINYITNTYVLKVVASLGIFFNFGILVILKTDSFKYSIYRCISSKFFCNLIVCITGLFLRVPACPIYCEDTYHHILYGWCSLNSFYISLLASLVSDILLLLNRYYVLKSVKFFFQTMSTKLNITFDFGLSLIFSIHTYFTIKIYENQNGLYAWSYRTEELVRISGLISYLSEIVIPLSALIFISYFVIKEYRCSVCKSMRIQSHTRRNYLRLEIRFTRMVITLTVFTFISRLTILLVDLFVSYVDIFD